MEYPEEIYATRNGGLLTRKQRQKNGSGWGRRRAYKVGRSIGYIKGLTQRPDPLAGYSNLTAAITAKGPIDWEQLNGRKTQCVNLDIGTVSGQLKRAPDWEADKLYGWRDNRMDHVYTIALNQAWEGKDGWVLWVEGEIPLVQNEEYGPFQKPESK